MDKLQAKNLIENTFNNQFDKAQFRNFIINFLDKINEDKAFSVGQAQVKEAFRKYVLSYQRIGQYTDKNGNIIDALIVHLNDKCSLDRSRTFLRNFVADYMHTKDKKNALVAFYCDNSADWRFSFVKLEISLKQDDKGNVKVANEYTPAKRYSYLVGELEPNHTAQSRLVELLVKEYPTLEEIEEAFNVEKVSKEFFAQYKELFLQLVDNLKDIRSKDDRINFEFTTRSITEANFCKKLLGQLVFLYFIQKKGWLGVPKGLNWGEGDKQFLRHTFEKAVSEGKNFFNDYLEPLFYNALANGERDEQIFDLLECKIPFLNGGLFEPLNGYDWVNTDIQFKNNIFSNTEKNKIGDTGTGILDVFDRYNFTVKEDEPLEKEVAVDPEMLGKVFEELLEVQDRKSKGAFYTPREIVHYMCQESLINYLATELNASEDVDSDGLTKQDLADFIHHSDQISDREAIASQKEKSTSVYKHIISENIRKNAEAIDKALADIKICDPAIGSGAFPVGMLNEIVRARISLVESGFLKETKKHSVYEYKRQAIQNSIYGVDIESGAVEIAKLRLWLSLVVEEDDIKNIKALPNLDYKIVCGNSLLNVERNLFNESLFRQLEELKPQYFNETRKSEKKRLKKEIDAIIKELTKDGTFDFEIYFSEVFHEKGGFDVVIANPPYIPYKKIAKMYNLTKYTSFNNEQVNKPNLYVYFIELALKSLLKSKGTMYFINPIAFLVQSDCITLRKFLLRKNIIEMLDLSYINVFKEADTYTVILGIQNINETKDFKYQRYLEINDIYNIPKLIFSKETALFDSEQKIVLSENLKLLTKINLTRHFINEYINIVCGTSKEGFGKCISNELTPTNKPVLQASDILKYKINWLGKFIEKDIFPVNKVNNYFNKPKVVMARMTDKIRCAIDLDKNYYCAKVNVIISKTNKLKILKTILGVLNSNLINFYYKETYRALHKKGDALGFDIPSIEKIPVPMLDEKNILISEIVDKILSITQTDDYLENQEKQNAVKEYEKQIDVMVYKLYDLTYEEILTIDKEFSMSEQEYNAYKL